MTDYTTATLRFPSYDGGWDFRGYTYKVPKAWELKTGDLVLVEVSKHDLKIFKVCLVSQVHPEPKLDPKATFEYRWAVQKVDLTEYEYRKAKQ